MPDSIQNEADIYVHNVALTKCQQQNVDTTHPCYHSMSKLQILATTTRRYYNPCYHKTSILQSFAFTKRRYLKMLMLYNKTLLPQIGVPNKRQYLQNVDTTVQNVELQRKPT